MTNVFIAPKIKVGFQKREDTFTGQLAYIIYYDEKGKLRKETSWNSWRDKKIDPQEFDNAPMDGFTLNKDVKRYSGGWFSSNRTLIRVHDPRGFEFEVTTENLIAILMHTDCLRRGLIGQFVYAWVGPELVLLPTNSEEYQNATKYTSGLAKKVKAKDLTPGVSYKTKREGDVIYIGRFNWYEYPGRRYYNRKGIRAESKAMVFTKDDGKTFFNKTSAEFLSEANSDQPVSNYAELVEKFNKKSYANKIIRYEFRPTTFDPATKKESYSYGNRLKRSSYFVEYLNGIFRECTVSLNESYNNDYDVVPAKTTVIFNGYDMPEDNYGGQSAIKVATGEVIELPKKDTNCGYYNYNSKRPTPLTLEQMQAQPFFDLYVTFENNRSRRVNSIYGLTSEEYGETND